MILGLWADAVWWAELIDHAGPNLVVPIVVAMITTVATPLLAGRAARKGADKGVGEVSRKVDTVVGQVTNGDTDAPRLRKDLDEAIRLGKHALAQGQHVLSELGSLRREVRGGFADLQAADAEESSTRRTADAAINQRLDVLAERRINPDRREADVPVEVDRRVGERRASG